MNDSMASVREEARKTGGDELVAKLDAAVDREREISKTFDALIEEAKALPQGPERTLGMAAISEAFSRAYGRVTVAIGQENKTDDAQIMVLAIRSLVNSIQIAVEDRDAQSSGVLDLIKQASDKGGE